MTEQRPLIEHVLDVVLYAPVGLLSALRADAPQLVRDGRQKVEQRVQVARWIGEMTVTYGRRELSKRFEGTTTQQPPVPIELADAPLAHHAPEPFEGYADLPAVKIVERLTTLAAGELHLVRAFESLHRNRRTVLAKVDQLLGD